MSIRENGQNSHHHQIFCQLQGLLRHTVKQREPFRRLVLWLDPRSSVISQWFPQDRRLTERFLVPSLCGPMRRVGMSMVYTAKRRVLLSEDRDRQAVCSAHPQSKQLTYHPVFGFRPAFPCPC
jgi:hypothetical protein